MTHQFRVLNILFCAVFIILWCSAAQSADVSRSSLSGFWELIKTSAGQFPEVTAQATAKPSKVSEIDAEEARWCVPQGLPYVMDRAGPIDIVVAPHEISISAERMALPRHLYPAGRPPPDPEVFDNTPVGYSTSQWKQGKLIVTTEGLSPGVGPAGLPRTPTSHVTESFELSGDQLKVLTSWSDPAVLRRPYRYSLIYRRLATNYTAHEYFCDPRDNGVGHP